MTFNPSRVSDMPTIDLSDIPLSLSSPCDYGIIKSPCMCRPDTGVPCGLLPKDKNQPFCAGCKFTGNGRMVYTGSDHDNEIIHEYYIRRNNQKKRYGRREIKEQRVCIWPGCPHVMHQRCKPTDRYCKEHGDRYRHRVRQWGRQFPGRPIDMEWVYREIKDYGSMKKKLQNL